MQEAKATIVVTTPELFANKEIWEAYKARGFVFKKFSRFLKEDIGKGLFLVDRREVREFLSKKFSIPVSFFNVLLVLDDRDESLDLTQQFLGCGFFNVLTVEEKDVLKIQDHYLDFTKVTEVSRGMAIATTVHKLLKNTWFLTGVCEVGEFIQVSAHRSVIYTETEDAIPACVRTPFDTIPALGLTVQNKLASETFYFLAESEEQRNKLQSLIIGTNKAIEFNLGFDIQELVPDISILTHKVTSRTNLVFQDGLNLSSTAVNYGKTIYELNRETLRMATAAYDHGK